MASAPDPSGEPSNSLLTALSSAVLRHAGESRQLVLGFSGGLDSSLLLAVSCQFVTQNPSFGLRALHVNHGIHADSDKWESACKQQCSARQVSCAVRRADIPAHGGRRVSEDMARRARYACFEDELAPNETLLLAHHLDDQLETLMLRLNRGAGVGGLSGMPEARPLGEGWLLRPWLNFSRPELLEAAQQLGVTWLEDPSNTQLHHDRNLLRNSLLPQIEARWPEYRKSWAKSLALLGDSAALNSDLAQMDLDLCSAQTPGRLRVTELKELSLLRRRNLLRYWLSRSLRSIPAWSLVMRLAEEAAIAAETPANWPCGEAQIYRYCGELVLILHDDFQAQDLLVPCPEASELSLELPNNGSLVINIEKQGRAEQSGREAAQLTVRYRRGGEVLRQQGRGSRLLKKAFNEAQIAPWLRDRTPLLYCGDQLIWAAGLRGLVTEEAVAVSSVKWLPPALEPVAL